MRCGHVRPSERRPNFPVNTEPDEAIRTMMLSLCCSLVLCHDFDSADVDLRSCHNGFPLAIDFRKFCGRNVLKEEHRFGELFNNEVVKQLAGRPDERWCEFDRALGAG